MPGIGPDAGTEPPPGEPELVSREVKPYSAITRVCQDPPEAPGPARHIKAYLPAAVAEAFPQEDSSSSLRNAEKLLSYHSAWPSYRAIWGLTVTGYPPDNAAPRSLCTGHPAYRLVAPRNQADGLDCLT